MNLWINPFLDVFYEWGENKYWITKADFLNYLNQHRRPMDGAIQDYLKERVPKWYYRFGFSTDIGGELGMDIEDTQLFPDILECWEKDLPYRAKRALVWPESHYFTDRMKDKMYEGYPNELMVESDVNNNKFFLDLYHQNDTQSRGWVQLIEVNNTVLNSIYFTGQKGKSWCDVTPLPKFMNWRDENPLKVK